MKYEVYAKSGGLVIAVCLTLVSADRIKERQRDPEAWGIRQRG